MVALVTRLPPWFCVLLLVCILSNLLLLLLQLPGATPSKAPVSRFRVPLFRFAVVCLCRS